MPVGRCDYPLGTATNNSGTVMSSWKSVAVIGAIATLIVVPVGGVVDWAGTGPFAGMRPSVAEPPRRPEIVDGDAFIKRTRSDRDRAALGLASQRDT